jgi:hypothetical protein
MRIGIYYLFLRMLLSHIFLWLINISNKNPIQKLTKYRNFIDDNINTLYLRALIRPTTE